MFVPPKTTKSCALAAALFFISSLNLSAQQGRAKTADCSCDPYQKLAEKKYEKMQAQQAGVVKIKKRATRFTFHRRRDPKPNRIRHAKEKIVACFFARH